LRVNHAIEVVSNLAPTLSTDVTVRRQLTPGGRARWVAT